MMSIFGGLAGTIAAFGVYGVTAHVTRLRRRELAIRLALGAQPRSLQALVLRHGILNVSTREQAVHHFHRLLERELGRTDSTPPLSRTSCE
jgi:hypothetical protein